MRNKALMGCMVHSAGAPEAAINQQCKFMEPPQMLLTRFPISYFNGSDPQRPLITLRV